MLDPAQEGEQLSLRRLLGVRWVSGDCFCLAFNSGYSFRARFIALGSASVTGKRVWGGRGPGPLFNQSLAYGGTNDNGPVDLFLSAPSASRRSRELVEIHLEDYAEFS